MRGRAGLDNSASSLSTQPYCTWPLPDTPLPIKCLALDYIGVSQDNFAAEIPKKKCKERVTQRHFLV
jgi:hypothetical protein